MSTNQARLTATRSPVWDPAGIGIPTLAIVVLGGASAAYVAVSLPELYRYTLTFAIVLNLVVLGMRWPRAAVVATLLFLPFLALIRRLLIADTGWVSNDPLILIGPIVAVFLLYRIYVLDDRPLDRDLLAKLVLGLLGVTVLQAFNPLGVGGLVAGLAGLLFLVVPLMWFLVGRKLGDDRSVAILLKAVVVVAVAVAVYGLFQTEFAPGERLPQWDQDWYEVAGYSALNVGEAGNRAIRPFSTFSSNGEYSAYLSTALIIIFALVAHRRPRALLAAPVVAFAVFSSGGRAVMALTALAAVILLGVRTRNLALGLLVVVLGIGTVYGAAAVFGPRLDRGANLSGQAITERNVSGLLHPLDPGKSSALARWSNMTGGVGEGFTNPAGSGTAAANLAGRNFSSDSKAGRETDNDVSDMFVSLGAVGGLLFLAIIFVSLKTVFSRYSREPSWMLFAVAGIMVAALGSWLNSGLYALNPLMWFLLGWATRPLPEPAGEAKPARGESRLAAVRARIGSLVPKRPLRT